MIATALVLAHLVLPAQAPDDAPPVVAPPAARPLPAPDEGAPPDGATDEPKAVDPLVGQLVDGATILGVTSDKRLPDGRPTSEQCGYERDVVVERPVVRRPGEAGPSTKVERAVLKFPCVRGDAGLVAGAPLLVLVDVEPPPELPVAPPDAPPPDGPVDETPFAPTHQGILTKPPRLLEGFEKAQGPLIEGGSRLYGPVLVEIEVRRTGRVREARVVRSANPRLDEETVRAAKQFLFRPAERDGVAVDALYEHEIEWTKEPVADEERRQRIEEDVVVVDSVFRKGELSNLGRVQLVNASSSVGLGIGAAVIDDEAYLQLRPNLDLHYGPLGVGFGAPFRLELLDFGDVKVLQTETWQTVTKDAGRFRIEDWDRLLVMPYSDWLRPVRYVSWGRKEDNLFVDVNRVNPITLGHGQLVRRYAPNADIDESNLFAEVDAYADFGGIETMIGPLPIPRIVGGLAFVKPLGLFMDDYVSRSLSFGVSYVTDLNAPTALVRSQDPTTRNLQLAIENRRFIYPERDAVIGRRVQGVGVDAEVKAVKWEFVDLKVYGDYSHLIFPDVPERDIAAFNGGGATLGTLLRLSFGQRPVRDLDEETEEVRLGRAPREMTAQHAARFRAEARVFSPQYLPSYWNPLYEVDKFQFADGLYDENQRAGLPSKVEYLASQQDEPWRYGYYLEASYAWVDVLALTAVYEDAWKMGGDFLDVPASKNVILHAETAALDLAGLLWLQAFATYHYRNFALMDWLRLGQFTTDNEVLYVGGRLQILFLSFNLGVQRGYRVEFLEEDLASLRPIEDGGVPLRHSSVGYRSQYNFNFDVELGWTW